MKKILIALCCFFLMCGISRNANAVLFHGVDFPAGAISFADEVVSFDPVIKSGQPGSDYLNPNAALGTPDYPEASGVEYVSLGDGGSITLRFVDNSLTGSGDSKLGGQFCRKTCHRRHEVRIKLK